MSEIMSYEMFQNMISKGSNVVIVVSQDTPLSSRLLAEASTIKYLPELMHFSFIKVNIEDTWAQDLIDTYEVDSVPTVLLFKKGKLLYKECNCQSKRELRKLMLKVA